ncbi:hypothetical protein C8Q72DRAFT_783725 [Fomitopsis betulina]|nr:hypothetical protein C8Q72DRAFT_783725 [Fomitopsis betulina]
MDVLNCHVGLDLAVSHSRKILEDEIDRCSTYMVALKSRLNTLAPISVLPPEALCEVFLHAAGVGDRGNGEGAGSHSYGWICVSHVCKHWRVVALSCPSLWSKIKMTTQRPWMSELLERSKRAPLYVTITVPSLLSHVHPSYSSLEVILGHLERTRSLFITNPADLRGRVHLLARPAPLLESLILRSQVDSAYISHDIRECILCRPENSHLRHLELHNTPLLWDNVVLPNLTRLTICHKSLQLRTVAPVQALVGALANMGHLEELVVDDALGDPHSYSPETKVSLPRLKHLRAVGYTRGCIALLNCLEVQSLSRLAIITDKNVEPSSTELLNAIAAKISSLGDFLCLSLTCVRLGWATQLFLDAYSRLDPSLSQPTPLHGPELSLSICHTEVDALLSDICNIIPIHYIHRLNVSARSLLPSTWMRLFQCTRKVTELAISACASDETFPAALLYRTPGKKGDFHYILPQLRALTLTRCYFHPYVHDPPLLVGGSLTSHLLDCFTERYEYGAEIEVLRLMQAINIPEAEVNWLKQTVRVVEWDGSLDMGDEVASTDTESNSSDDSDDSDYY